MEMPHRQAPHRLPGAAFINTNRKQKTTISQYLCNITCPSCGQSCDRGICEDCVKNQSRTLVTLHEKCRQNERIYSSIKTVSYDSYIKNYELNMLYNNFFKSFFFYVAF